MNSEPNSTKQEVKHSIDLRVNSKLLDRVIYVKDLPETSIRDLKLLQHEITAERASMFEAADHYTRRMENALEPREVNDFARLKLKQINKKLGVYATFSKLLKNELKWKLAVSSVNRTKFVLRAAELGITEIQINTLLDPDNEIGLLINTDSEYGDSLKRREAATIATRIQALRNHIFMEEFCKILSKEFDSAELEQIRKEATSSAVNSIDWKKLEDVLNETIGEDGTF